MEVPQVQCSLVNRLHRQIQCYGVNIDPSDIPVYPLKDSWPIRYHSAIALKLAKLTSENPADIAAKILQGLSSQSTRVEITVGVIPSGIITFELTDSAVAAWLQQMTQIPLPASSFSQVSTLNVTESQNQNLFYLQYSHARCCSLLRLADRDRLIRLAEPHLQTAPTLWLWIQPDPISWLNLDGKLRLSDPGERQLIGQLMAALDGDSKSSDRKFWQTQANLISDAFQAFYSQCRIWGEVKLKTPKKAQARLGLISITQAVLRYILQEKLGIAALLEL